MISRELRGDDRNPECLLLATEKWPRYQQVSRNRSCAPRKTDDADTRDFCALLRARRERPRRRAAAEQRDEVAASHCPMPPVLPTERIAHLGTADCCIHPPGRNEMIAITPPKIFSKEVAQKQATPFPRQDLLTARNRF